MALVSSAAPRFALVPAGDDSVAVEGLEFCRANGLHLDPDWQEPVLSASLLRRPDGKFAASEVGVVVPRQNGKDEILIGRELVGLFLLGERMITHSAHMVDTSLEHFRRLLSVIEDSPDLDREVRRVSNTNGREGIELKSGCRIRFRSRSKGGGRGFSGDLLVLNEAMFLPEFAFGALLPTLSAMPNPQVWYTGSPVDQEIHENGVVFARVRERGLLGEAKRLAFFEWSPPVEMVPAEVTEEFAADPDVWAAGNPAFPDRISFDAIAGELEALDLRSFAVERLGIGDWPRTDGQMETVVSSADWLALHESKSKLSGPVCLVFDVSPDRRASIAAAGPGLPGLMHVEVGENRQGTGWLPSRLAELCEDEDVLGVWCDGFGPAAGLVHACEEAGVKVTTTNAGEMAQACGQLLDGVAEQTFRHLGSDELFQALRGAKARPLGDAWAWSRKNSKVDISPLVATTLALWAASQQDSGEIHIY